MTDPAALVAAVPEPELHAWVLEQRWFASKSRDVAVLNVLERVVLREEAPLFVLALIEARFHTGTHELYQLPVGLRPEADGWTERVIAEVEGWTVYDGLADPELARELLQWMRSSSELTAGEGTVRFHWAEQAARPDGAASGDVRPIGVEQSNSSIVFGEALILKAFRKVEPGVNPELELLRFLQRQGFRHIAPLVGWYEYGGRLMDSTLGTLQEFLAGAREGWQLCLDDLEGFVERARELGRVTAEMHSVLGSDRGDPDFAPEEPSTESLSLLTATVDEEIERVFVDLDPEDPALEPIAGRGQDVRERLQALSHIGAGGRAIRTHGDYHLGQTMLADRGWVILDFEGEPARSLTRAAPQALAAARRGRDAALVRLRRLGRRPAARHGGARGLGGARARRLPRRLLRARRRARCSRPATTPSTSCSACSSSRRPSTSCATSSTTGPTGSRSRWPGSCGCSTASLESAPGPLRVGARRRQAPGEGSMQRRVRLAVLAGAAAFLFGGAAPARAQQSEVVTLLQDLVRIDTSNPPGNEALVDELLRARLEPLGFRVEIIPTPAPGKSHLIARLPATAPSGEKPLLLAGHADVVGVERPLWTKDPFAGDDRERAPVRPRRDGLQGRAGGVHRGRDAARARGRHAHARPDPAQRGRRGGRDLQHVVARREPLGQDRRERVDQRGRLDLRGRARRRAADGDHDDRQELALGHLPHARDLDALVAAAARQRAAPARARA